MARKKKASGGSDEPRRRRRGEGDDVDPVGVPAGEGGRGELPIEPTGADEDLPVGFRDPLGAGLPDPLSRYGMGDDDYREPTTVLAEDPAMFHTLRKLNRDLQNASRSLGHLEIRFLCDLYYQIQKLRKGAFMQVKLSQRVQQEAEGEDGETKVVVEPNEFITWLFQNMQVFENNIKKSLDIVSDQSLAGRWAKSHVGVGPVLTAGYLSHFDITKAPTVGNFWSFAGLNPTMKWEKGEKRPWNGRLKVLAWLMGSVMIRFCNHPKATYGRHYIVRREREIKKNWRGDFAPLCVDKLDNFNIGKTTDAYAWYSGSYPQDQQDAYFEAVLSGTKPPTMEADKPGAGRQCLPPARILLRAQRLPVKLFISHLHQVMYIDHYKHEPQRPYAFTDLGHEHFIPPYNFVNGEIVIQDPADLNLPRSASLD